jgi:hypothetical protein
MIADYLIEDPWEGDANGAVTHLWLYKGYLEQDVAAREAFSRKTVKRISREFPEYAMPSWMGRYAI